MYNPKHRFGLLVTAACLAVTVSGCGSSSSSVSVRVPGDEEKIIRLWAWLPAPGRAGG